MTDVVGSGEVPIFPTFVGFRSAVVTQTDAAASDGGSRFGSVFKTIVGGALAGVAVGFGTAIAGAAAIGAKGLDRALNIQDAKQKLASLGNSATDVDTIMQNATAAVKGTAFSLGDAAGVAASAVAAGIKPGEELTRTLTATANAAAIAGVPLNEMGGIINKVAANGKLSTDVLQQFQDRGVPLLQAVANEYGVTNDEAQKMVTDGKVSFADFQTALEKSVGDGAVGAGKTARGAFANIGAAFSRLGALFVQPAVDGAPTLFTSIANAVDRAKVALTPLASAFADRLTPAMAGVSAWIDTIDFGAIVSGVQNFFSKFTTGVQGVYDLVINGDFTSKFGQAFNLDEDGRVVAVLYSVHEALDGIFTSIASGNTSGLGSAFADLGDNLQSIWSIAKPLSPIFESVAKGIGSIAQPIGDIINQGIGLLPPVLSALSGALGFLKDNAGLVVPVFIAIGAAMAIYQASVVASNIADLVGLPIKSAQVAADFAKAASSYAAAGATDSATLATKASAAANSLSNGSLLGLVAKTIALKVAQLASAAATGIATAAQWLFNASNVAAVGGLIATGAAFVATRVAQLAGAAATGVATAAQWLFNAALDANPIGIVVLAIAALVAGLIWFFTQTDLGRSIWQGFMDFLVGAWNNIVAVAQVVWQFLSDVITNVWNFIVAYVTTYITILQTIITTVINVVLAVWTAVWQGISDFFTGIWNFIVTFVTIYIQTVLAIITTVTNVITSVWSAVWQGISDVFGAIWNFIVAYVTTYIQIVLSVIQAVTSTISSVWNSVWSGISSFFSGVWNGIVGFISGVVSAISNYIQNMVNGISSGVQSAIGFITGLPGQAASALGNLGSTLIDSGRALIQGFIDGITGMLGKVGDAVGGVMDFVGSFFPHSPAERGPFSGSGWAAVSKSGAAVADEWASGFNDRQASLSSSLNAAMTVASSVTAAGSSSSSAAASGTSAPAQPYYDMRGANFGADMDTVTRAIAKGARRAYRLSSFSPVRAA